MMTNVVTVNFRPVFKMTLKGLA